MILPLTTEEKAELHNRWTTIIDDLQSDKVTSDQLISGEKVAKTPEDLTVRGCALLAMTLYYQILQDGTDSEIDNFYKEWIKPTCSDLTPSHMRNQIRKHGIPTKYRV